MTNPGFFKVFKEEFYGKQLTLPLGFVECFEGQLPERVVLKDRNCNFWQVKIAKTGDRTHFDDGWPSFFEDSLVKDGDMLVFEYLFKGLFHVKIFDPSSCEKKGAERFIYKGLD